MAKKKEVPIKVIQDKENIIPTTVLAASIVQISNTMRNIANTGLNERAIQVLVRDASGVNMTEVQKVLKSIKYLKETYCS